MFVRHVTMRLRADSIARFARIIGSEVIPLLRRQAGFLDYITLISPERAEAVVITFWDTEDSQEAFNRAQNPQVSKSLFDVIEESPKVAMFEILDSTSLKLVANKA